MRPAAVALILASLALTSCSTTSYTLSTDVWLCAYQLGDRYRNDSGKPDIIAYDTVTSAPNRITTLTYLLPIEDQAPAKRTVTCDAAPWGFGVIAEDGVRYPAPMPNTYTGNVGDDPTVQGPVADQVREAVRQTGIHVHIAGIPQF
jgi:hypothetical protein